MRRRLIGLIFIYLLVFFNCCIHKNPLNTIDFKDNIINVQETMINFCMYSDRLCWQNSQRFNIFKNPKGELYLNNVKIGEAEELLSNPEKLQKINEFQRLNVSDIKQFTELYKKLNRNHISGIGRDMSGGYAFHYRNDPQNKFDNSRMILLLKFGNSDTINFLKGRRILERRGDLILTCPIDAKID